MAWSRTAAMVYRDGPVGTPAQPDKSEIRPLLKQYEDAIAALTQATGASAAKGTYSELNSVVGDYDDGDIGIVFADANESLRGVYKRVSGAWIKQYDLPSDIAQLAADAAEAQKELAETARVGSEAARDIAAGYASDAVSQGNVPIYSTALGVPALTIPNGIAAFQTRGYGAPDGSGAALYRLKSAPEASRPGDLVSNGSTKRWEIAEQELRPEMFGAKPDFDEDALTGTDNKTALDAFHAGLKAFRRIGVLAGMYLTSSLAPVEDTVFMLRGVDRGVSGYVFAAGASDGLSITQNDYSFPTLIYDTGFFTLGQEAIVPLSVEYSASDSINNRSIPRCLLARLQVRGWDVYEHGPDDGVYTKNIHANSLYEVRVTGRRDLDALTQRQSFGNMVSGIVLDSDVGMSAIPGDIEVATCQVFNAQIGFNCIGENEGLTFNNVKAIGCWKGIVNLNSSIRPNMNVFGSHFNVFDKAIEATNTPQSIFSDNLIYKYVGSDGLTTAIDLISCDLSQIDNNTFINSCTDKAVSGGYDGVRVHNSIGCTVDNILHERGSVTVRLSGTSTLCEVGTLITPGSYTNETDQADVKDESSGTNFVGGRILGAFNSSAVTVTSGGVSVLTRSIPTDVRTGQRYRVSAQISLTKGATGGPTAVSILKTGGAALVVFHQSVSAMKGRIDPQAAGAEGVINMDGEMTVIGSGNLEIGLQAVSIGSNANVAIGDCQMTVSKI